MLIFLFLLLKFIIVLPVGFFDLDDYYIAPLIKQNNLLQMEIHFKETNSTYLSVIDINSRSCWVQKAFNTPNKTIIPIKPNRCVLPDGMAYNRTIILGNNNYAIVKMPINEYSSLPNCDYESSIGIPYGFESNTFTIFDALDKEFLIRRIGFYYDTQSNSSHIRFGYQDIHDDSVRESVAICSVNKNRKQWNCRLKAVLIGSMEEIDKTPEGSFTYLYLSNPNLYLVNQPIFFETIQRFLFVPNAFYSYILSEVFQPYLDSNQCTKKEKEEMRIITCDNSVINSIPTIHFVIENNLISFSSGDLFDKYNDHDYMFLIACDMKDENNWSLGNFMLERYGLILDMHLELIYLKHNEGLRKRVKIIDLESSNLDKNTLQFIRNVFSVILSFGIVGIIMLLISLFQQKEIWVFNIAKLRHKDTDE